jgi:hypothetical protein
LHPEAIEFGDELAPDAEENMIIHPFSQRTDSSGTVDISAGVSDRPIYATAGFSTE